MPFKLPTLNLQANIWSGPGVPPTGQPRLTVPCQLRMIRTGFLLASQSPNNRGAMLLLVPKGTDVRGPRMISGIPDTIECPAGSGRYYGVLMVDDVAKGFGNEYRVVSVIQESFPIPLP